MSGSLEIIREKQRKRYQVLHKLWEATGGREYVDVDFFEVARQAGLCEGEVQEVYHYFTNEGLFGNRLVDGGVSLSHQAIVEIEQSVANPGRGTEHFPSTVIQHFNGPVGSVQTGPHSVAHVTQNFGAGASDVLNLIRELRESLQSFPPEQRQEVIEVVDALEEEVQSSAPRKGRIKAFLGQLSSFTANTASNVIAAAIAKSLGM